MLTLPHNLIKTARVLVLGLVLAACAAAPTTTPAAMPVQTQRTSGVMRESNTQETIRFQDATPASTPASVSTSTPGASPTITPTPGDTRADVIIWWPASLLPDPDTPAEATLNAQVDEFQSAHGMSVLLRAKRLLGAGGIMSTLRTAGQVAPGALPDLALVRREQLLAAAGTGLIYPLDNLLPDSALRGLYPQALALGEIDGVLYGVAYTLRVQHIVYRESVFTTP
ncbi:MAG: hypothetical protein JW910_11090, partial [Anaerolineae bacterium]|nr:hypothetical protein [Anaerolineae bacterium]